MIKKLSSNSDIIFQALSAGIETLGENLPNKLIRHKAPREIVTNCDVTVEQSIIKKLMALDPKSEIVSEEVGEIGEGLPEKRTWILDPIDGTHNFAFDLPMYGISLALFEGGKLLEGCIYLPFEESFYYGVEGKGAYKNQQAINVSDRRLLNQSMIAYDNQYHKHPMMFENLKRLHRDAFTTRTLGSAAFDLCMVAEGRFEARVFHKTKSVDVAAGRVLVTEAGGRVSRFDNSEPSLNSLDFIVSNGHIHNELVNCLNIEE